MQSFFNRQGNFCPSSRDCTGARYPQGEFNAFIPLRDTKVYLRTGTIVVGQGTTDAAGNFSISWFRGGTGGANLAGVQLVWHAEHRDGRFVIQNGTGGVNELAMGSFFLGNGDTSQLGQFLIGSAASPDQIANVYDGAWRDWPEFSLSNRVLAYFSGVSVRAFNSTCATSCADGEHDQSRMG